MNKIKTEKNLKLPDVEMMQFDLNIEFTAFHIHIHDIHTENTR